MANRKRVKKSYASSPSFTAIYGKSQRSPKKTSRKKVFVKV